MKPYRGHSYLTLPSSANAIGNTTQILTQAFKAPHETTLLVPPWELSGNTTKPAEIAKAKPVEAPKGKLAKPPKGKPAAAPSAKPALAKPVEITPETIVVDPTYKLVLRAVIILTAVCGLADIVLAWAWTDPTQLQQQAFSAVDIGWKGGLGAIFGLLGGKQV